MCQGMGEATGNTQFIFLKAETMSWECFKIVCSYININMTKLGRKDVQLLYCFHILSKLGQAVELTL